ncbi:ODF3A protein, partial [Bucorvus abyssinicus]|nr:ODF3A protein [Bucorvus abyssinicus]
MSDNAWVGTWRPHRPRGPIAALYSGPGPKYGLPTNVGYHLHDPSRARAPAYSFGMRVGDRQEERSPGPAYLLPPGTTTKGKDGIPAFSMYSRPRDLLPIHTPGPGCYSPERAGRLAFPSAPACSLRSRTRMGIALQTPGSGWSGCPLCQGLRYPGTQCSRVLGDQGAGGSEVLGDVSPHPRLQTPGPCNYRMVDANVYKRRAPQYSMLARNTLPGDTGTKPGPGAYSPEQVRGLQGVPPAQVGVPLALTTTISPTQQGRQRGVTFGIRHSDYLAPLIVDVP